MKFVKIEPYHRDIPQLSVFLSYKTEQWPFVRRLADQLGKTGYQLLLIPPSATGKRLSESQVKRKLRRFAHRADIVCIVASDVSLGSKWVQYEYWQAAERTGQVTFVVDNSLIAAGDRIVAANPGNISGRTYVKCQTVRVDLDSGEWDKPLELIEDNFMQSGGLPTDQILHTPTTDIRPRQDRCEVNGDVWGLARRLVNDLEQGGWEELGPFCRSFPHRPLYTHSWMRRFARSSVLGDKRFHGKFVFDVIPFLDREIDVAPRDPSALRAVLDKWGCHKARTRLDRGIAQVEYVAYTVPWTQRFRATVGTSTLHAFVLVGTPGWQEIVRQQVQGHRDLYASALDVIRQQIDAISEK